MCACPREETVKEQMSTVPDRSVRHSLSALYALLRGELCVKPFLFFFATSCRMAFVTLLLFVACLLLTTDNNVFSSRGAISYGIAPAAKLVLYAQVLI